MIEKLTNNEGELHFRELVSVADAVKEDGDSGFISGD